jgi:hypothetical protein
MAGGVVQITDADMLAGAKQVRDGVDQLGVLYTQVLSQAEELRAVGMKGMAGTAMHGKVGETNQKVISVNQLANDKANAADQYVQANSDGEQSAAGFFGGL